MFQSLQELIAGYPVTEALRSTLLDHLHERLAETLPHNPSGVVLRATRALALTSTEELAGGALVDALKHANEELLKALEAQQPSEDLAAAYAQFVKEWCGKEDVDANLVRCILTPLFLLSEIPFYRQKLYLVGSLQALIKRQTKNDTTVTATPTPAPAPPVGALLAAHVRLLLALAAADLPKAPASPHRILRTAARYTSTLPSDSRVWLARLHAETAHGTAASASAVAASARKAVPACVEIWLWSAQEQEELLAESMSMCAEVHQALLMRFVDEDQLGALPSTAARRERVEHVARQCLPSTAVWVRAFDVLAAMEDDETLLRDVYEYWRGAGDVVEATLAWAKWLLLKRGRGDEAMRVIARARGAVGGATISQRWASVVRHDSA